jgi:hypothetical protein
MNVGEGSALSQAQSHWIQLPGNSENLRLEEPWRALSAQSHWTQLPGNSDSPKNYLPAPPQSRGRSGIQDSHRPNHGSDRSDQEVADSPVQDVSNRV